ncbi:MAG TPA: DinB family protein [Terracidiphilus sp.]|nr:DinB family protein [Terracidiphilus sp.]
MPVPAAIAVAAGEFAQNTGFLQRAVADLTPEQWLGRPGDHSNHITWIVGHVIWARHAIINRVGGNWSCPGIEAFARSTKIGESASYPSPEALLALWRDSAAALDAALSDLTPEALAAPAPPGPPSPDGKVSGFICVLAWHETYHLGQVAYLRSWLGHSGLFG